MSVLKKNNHFWSRLFFLIWLLAPTQSLGEVYSSSAEWDVAKLSLIEEENYLSLEILLSDGYKTYWQFPGNGSYSPRFFVSSSQEKIEAIWPKPERFDILGYKTLGYQDKVVLPLVIPLTPGETVEIDVDIPVCSNSLCIPLRTTLRSPGLKGDVGLSSLTRKNQMFESPDLHLIRSPEGQKLLFSTTLSSPIKADDVIVAAPELDTLPIFLTSSIVESPENTKILSSELSLPDDLQMSKATVKLKVFSYIDDKTPTIDTYNLQIKEYDGTIMSHSYQQSLLKSTLPLVMLFAFLGGLIINLMPCVIPLIGLKFSKALTLPRRKRQSYFLSQSIGILFSISLLSLIFLVGYHSLDIALWGQQLQIPVVVISISFVLWLFTLQLLDVAHFSLPSGVHNRLSSYFHHNNLLQPFLSGVLIPIIATPCTAPFIATSLASALLSSSALEGTMILMSMGIGLAFPSLLFAIYPKNIVSFSSIIVSRIINYIMVILLGGFVIWFISLLIELHSTLLSIVLGISLAFISLLFLSVKIFSLRNSIPYFFILPLFVITILVSFSSPSHTVQSSFSPQNISSSLLRGYPVLVSISADWCLTCKVNDVVLQQDEVVEWMNENKVVFITGDWTLPDKSIEQYLNLHNRYGIPFTALHLPGDSKTIVLPDILTTGSIVSYLGAKKKN